MTVTTNRKQNINYTIFLSFKKFFLTVKKISGITKIPIFLFLIFRKLKKDLNIKQKSLRRLFFFNQIHFIIKHNKFSFLLLIKVFIKLNLIIFCRNKISKKTLKTSTTNVIKKISNLVKTELSKINQSLVIKKEYLVIKLNYINFFVLVDKLKSKFKSKKILRNFFQYYKINKTCLINEFDFKILFSMHLNSSFKYLDRFIFYLLKQVNKIFDKKSRLNEYRYFHFLNLTNQFYIRYETHFFINVFTKMLYKEQVSKELQYFLKKKSKINMSSLSLVNIKIQNMYFLGFDLSFKKNQKHLIVKANLIKIIIRFFFLGYINKLSKPRSHFVEYFNINQFLSLIKLKLIIQSLNSYYKIVKNKKYIILKLILMFKVTILKVFTSKFNYKSRAKILQLYKKDFSRFIFKIINGMSRSLVYRICFGYRIS